MRPLWKALVERADHRLLADEIDEALRPVLAGKHPVGAGAHRIVSAAVHTLPVGSGPRRAGR